MDFFLIVFREMNLWKIPDSVEQFFPLWPMSTTHVIQVPSWSILEGKQWQWQTGESGHFF